MGINSDLTIRQSQSQLMWFEGEKIPIITKRFEICHSQSLIWFDEIKSFSNQLRMWKTRHFEWGCDLFSLIWEFSLCAFSQPCISNWGLVNDLKRIWFTSNQITDFALSNHIKIMIASEWLSSYNFHSFDLRKEWDFQILNDLIPISGY